MIKTKAPKQESRQVYIATSYVLVPNKQVQDYQRRYYKHLDSAQRYAFLERLKGRQVDIYNETLGEWL